MLLFLAHLEEDEPEGESILMEDKVWSKLPQELLFAILARLPLPSFLRFRAVCQHWNTLLRNPSSSTSIFSSPPTFHNKPWAIFITDRLSWVPCPALGQSIHPCDGEERQIRLRWHRCELDFIIPSDRFIVSNAGQVLVQQKFYLYLLCNPLLRDWIKLPLLPKRGTLLWSPIVGAVFGLDPAPTSFKVIWGQQFPSREPKKELVRASFLYSSTTGRWNKVVGNRFLTSVVFPDNGALCKNIYYWSTVDLDLLAFDFEQERWYIHKTRWVPECKPPKHYSIWEWQEKLMMIAQDSGRIAIWQLSDDNQWHEFHTLTQACQNLIIHHFVPFRSSSMGNIVLLENWVRNKVFAYNFVSKTFIISDVANDSSLISRGSVSFYPSLEPHSS